MAADITSNLELWCKFNGNALDSSGNLRNGSIINTPSYVATGLDLESSSSQYVTHGPSVGIDGVSALTIFQLIRLESLFDFQTFSSKYANNSFRTQLLSGGSGLGTSSEVVCIIANNTTSNGRTSTAPLSTGVDLYITMVYDGTQTGNANRLKLYVGTTQLTLTFTGTIPATAPNNTSNPFYWGRQSSFYCDGILKEGRIYSRALTAEDVAAVVALGNVDDDPPAAVVSPSMPIVFSPVMSPRCSPAGLTT